MYDFKMHVHKRKAIVQRKKNGGNRNKRGKAGNEMHEKGLWKNNVQKPKKSFVGSQNVQIKKGNP